MEEQGMDRRKRLFRAGLLIFLTLTFFIRVVFFKTVLWAEEGEILEVQIETSPSDPTVNNPLSVYVLVKHPNPRGVNVEPPRFPSSLALERVSAEVRTNDQGERWTSVEFLFTPLRAGSITFEPFEVKTPANRNFSSAVIVSIGEDTARRYYEPSFRWLGRAPTIVTGERGELFLELLNWDPVRKVPQGVLQGKAPETAILEESPPYKVREGVYRYTITVIPLDSGAVKLEDVSFYSDIYALTIPQITVPVRPARRVSDLPGEVKEVPPDSARQDDITIPVFPGGREKVFFLFRGEYNQIVTKAKTLWEESRRAEALAEIRQNERDRLSGPFLVSLRRDTEQALGLGLTDNERWRPLKIPLPLWVIFGFIILSAGVFLFILRPIMGSQRRIILIRKGNGLVIIIVLVFVAVLISVFLEEGMENFPGGSPASSGKAAVLKATQGYRIPDFKGAVSDHFDEGQPVVVGDYNGDWCFAETPDGRSGWVPRVSVVPY
jgi:hypothetical protein